jgi:hypothetical protein
MKCLLQILMMHQCLAFSPLCPPRRLPAFFTILAHPFPPFGRVIPPMPTTQRPIGPRRSSIKSWAVRSSGIINIYFKSDVMANGSTVASFPPPMVLIPQFQKPNKEVCSIAPTTITWTLSTWTSCLETVSLLADIAMLSSLLTAPCDTIGLLASRLSPQWTLYLHSVSSVLQLVCFNVAFNYSDSDLKLFRLAVSKYLINDQSKVVPTPDLIDNQSKVVAALAKRQSANGLVELH